MYCGCATKANQIKWAVFGVCLGVATILLITWGVVFDQMLEAFGDCYESQGCSHSGGIFGIWWCDSQADMDYCADENHHWVVAYHVLLVFWIIFLIASPIPLCIMCCCTSRPVTTHPTYAQGAVVTTHPTYAMGAVVTTYPAYTQGTGVPEKC